MKILKKLLCWMFGHRSICLHRHTYNYNPDDYNGTTSTSTGWKCERCEHTFTEGWDE